MKKLNIYHILGLILLVSLCIHALVIRHAEVAKYEAYKAANKCKLVDPPRTNNKGQKAHQCGDKEVYIDPYNLPEQK